MPEPGETRYANYTFQRQTWCICRQCGSAWWAKRADARTCSALCRKAHSRGTPPPKDDPAPAPIPDPPHHYHESGTGATALLAAAAKLPRTNPARARLIRQANAAERSRRAARRRAR